MSKQEFTNCDTVQSSGRTDRRRFSARVLVADDEPGNLKLTELQLRRLGLEVVSCVDGQEAIYLAMSEEFDMIFMDMQMPVIDGFRATAQMRKQGLGTPIIALTAYAFCKDRERCIQAGCDDYIAKPVNPELMQEIVKKYSPRPAAAG